MIGLILSPYFAALIQTRNYEDNTDKALSKFLSVVEDPEDTVRKMIENYYENPDDEHHRMTFNALKSLSENHTHEGLMIRRLLEEHQEGQHSP